MTSHDAVRGRDHFQAYVTTETKVASVQALLMLFFHDLLLACVFEENCHILSPDNPNLSRTSTDTFFLVLFAIIVQVVKCFVGFHRTFRLQVSPVIAVVVVLDGRSLIPALWTLEV